MRRRVSIFELLLFPLSPCGRGWRAAKRRAGRGVSRISRRLKNTAKHNIRIVQNLIIPEPHHTKALIGKPAIASKIGGLTVVLTAVYLNHQAALETHKINNVSSDYSLAFEFDMRQPMSSQPVP
jgi:hypothetical protein